MIHASSRLCPSTNTTKSRPPPFPGAGIPVNSSQFQSWRRAAATTQTDRLLCGLADGDDVVSDHRRIDLREGARQACATDARGHRLQGWAIEQHPLARGEA